MKTSSQKILTTVLLMAVATLMTACGSSNTATSTDLASRSSATTTTDASNKALAVCNYASASGLAAKQKAYQDSSGYRFDYVWVRLTTLPSGFASDSNYIAMWKWMANASGSTYIDQTALSFALVDSTTNKYITNWKTTLKWSDVSATASSMGYADPASFFARVNILVKLNDATGQYDALKITSYNSSTNQAATQLDSLLPLFSANPAAYATESDGSTRASVLQALHPFASYKSQGYSTSQFQAMSNSYCF